MPIIARVRDTRRTDRGIEVDVDATGLGDGTRPNSGIARRAKVRALIASGLTPDDAPQDIDSIRSRYGLRASVIEAKEWNPEREPTEEEKEVFGPVAELASTYRYTILVSSRTSFGP